MPTAYPETTDIWWTEREAAEWLGVHPFTLRLWHKQGTGPPATWIDGRRYYKAEGVQAWLRPAAVPQS